jgi:hypothetical protein
MFYLKDNVSGKKSCFCRKKAHEQGKVFIKELYFHIYSNKWKFLNFFNYLYFSFNKRYILLVKKIFIFVKKNT